MALHEDFGKWLVDPLGDATDNNNDGRGANDGGGGGGGGGGSSSARAPLTPGKQLALGAVPSPTSSPPPAMPLARQAPLSSVSTVDPNGTGQSSGATSGGSGGGGGGGGTNKSNNISKRSGGGSGRRTRHSPLSREASGADKLVRGTSAKKSKADEQNALRKHSNAAAAPTSPRAATKITENRVQKQTNRKLNLDLDTSNYVQKNSLKNIVSSSFSASNSASSEGAADAAAVPQHDGDVKGNAQRAASETGSEDRSLTNVHLDALPLPPTPTQLKAAADNAQQRETSARENAQPRKDKASNWLARTSAAASPHNSPSKNISTSSEPIHSNGAAGSGNQEFQQQVVNKSRRVHNASPSPKKRTKSPTKRKVDGQAAKSKAIENLPTPPNDEENAARNDQRNRSSDDRIKITYLSNQSDADNDHAEANERRSGGAHENNAAALGNDGDEPPSAVDVRATGELDINVSNEAFNCSALFHAIGMLESDQAIVDGFFELGDCPAINEDNPLQPLSNYAENKNTTIIIVDKRIDFRLKIILNQCRALMATCPHPLLLARMLSLFVSSVMGGAQPVPSLCEDSQLPKLYEKHLRAISTKKYALLGDFTFGGSRERSLLFKYLADRLSIPSVLWREDMAKDDGASATTSRATTRHFNTMTVDKKGHVVDLMHNPGAFYHEETVAAEQYIQYLDLPGYDSAALANQNGTYSSTHASSSIQSHVDRQRWLEPADFSSKLTLVAKAGSGSFGEVWRASLAGYTIAVKILHTQGMSQVEQMRVISEVGLLQELDHENIVRYLGREIVRDDLRIFMEYMPYSLYDMVQRVKKKNREPFPKDEITFVMMNITKGLTYLHNLSSMVVHRDLKSKNVLIEFMAPHEDITRVKLCDFGVAKVLTDTTCADSLVGTTRWMAPEVIATLYGRGDNGHRKQPYNEKADIWSLGMCLYELMEIAVPYAEYSQWDVRGKILSGQLPTITKKSERMQHLLQLLIMCLKLDPLQRPPAKSVLQYLLAG